MVTANLTESADRTRPRKRLVADGGRPGIRTRGRRVKDRVGGVPTSIPTSVPKNISTESGVVVFNTVVGIGMFLAQVVAARNLAGVQGSAVSLWKVAGPAVIAVAAITITATLLPSA